MSTTTPLTFVFTPFLYRHCVSSTSSRSFNRRSHVRVTCIPPTASLIRPTNHSSDPSEFIPIVSRSPSEQHESESKYESSEPSTTLSGGDFVPPSSGNSGDSGSNDNEDSGSGDDPSDSSENELSTLLSDKKVSASDIPKDILTAYKSKIIPLWAVSNYLVARSNPISRLLLSFPSMRDRFLADKLLLLKILIEEGIGIFGKLSAEYEQRRSNFWREGEFVLTNLIIALLADFALVYFPAPSLSLKPTSTSAKGIGAWLSSLSSSLPSNVFQTDRPFTMAQRAGGFALKASQLFCVGFLCSFSGVIITNGLVYVRERLDKTYKPETTKQNPFLTSVFYGTFLGLSSGSRYQLVNGVENIIFPRVFAKSPAILEQGATFALRYANTFWGSQQWVMFSRFLNLQKMKASDSGESDSKSIDTPQ